MDFATTTITWKVASLMEGIVVKQLTGMSIASIAMNACAKPLVKTSVGMVLPAPQLLLLLLPPLRREIPIQIVPLTMTQSMTVALIFGWTWLHPYLETECATQIQTFPSVDTMEATVALRLQSALYIVSMAPASVTSQT